MGGEQLSPILSYGDSVPRDMQEAWGTTHRCRRRCVTGAITGRAKRPVEWCMAVNKLRKDSVFAPAGYSSSA
jgi:hypothetical protein